MMMPSIFGESLFDNWMSFPFEREFFGKGNPTFANAGNVMKTDVKETEQGYELDIDMPGFKKEDINAKLDNGYLTISAVSNVNNDQKDENGKYIRRERYSGSVSRSFYVGKDVKQEDIQARFENGILKLGVPKKEAKAMKENQYIAIEG